MYRLFVDLRWPPSKHKYIYFAVGAFLLMTALGDSRAEVEVPVMIEVTSVTLEDDLGSTAAPGDLTGNLTTWTWPLGFCNNTSECGQGLACFGNLCSCPRNCKYVLNKCDCGHGRLFPWWYFLIGGLLGLVVSYYCVQEIKSRSKKNQNSEPEIIFIARRPSSDGRFRVTGDASALHLHTGAPPSPARDRSPPALSSQLQPTLNIPVTPLPPIGQTYP
ncbi:uncharacterized protein LOC125048055 [Penaeus chinensis]|uniref:uncharacterized protein LOC125048055 n=1 Tax=Penaeus chinensis TaxID=139456 RepID=UPI001FB7CC07|nr:uncharacterized protein LOC125048055 [Penaeus chinensis]